MDSSRSVKGWVRPHNAKSGMPETESGIPKAGLGLLKAVSGFLSLDHAWVRSKGWFFLKAQFGLPETFGISQG